MSDSPLFEKYGQTFESGKRIFNEGDVGQHMYIIQEGKVRISKNMGGKDHILAILGKGDFFGEMAIVSRVQRSASVTAVGTVQLLSFDRQGFKNMIEKNSKIALNIIDKLCRRLMHANMQIQHLVKRNDKSLVALNLYYAFKEKERAEQHLLLDRVTEEIALNLEIPVERVGTVIEMLAKAGIVELKPNSVTLLNENALREAAEAVEAS
jgi:CRP-like cAMP-binding protein